VNTDPKAVKTDRVPAKHSKDLPDPPEGVLLGPKTKKDAEKLLAEIEATAIINSEEAEAEEETDCHE